QPCENFTRCVGSPCYFNRFLFFLFLFFFFFFLLPPFDFSDFLPSSQPLRRPKLRQTSIKPPQNPPVPFPYNPPPSNPPKTRFSPSFLQKSEFESFALRVHFLAIFRRLSGWLKISALVCTWTPLSTSTLFRMPWRQLASTSRISEIMISG
ncbi:hypothetical protein LINGRAHAP2_LOCUS10592, partial [Linum grandiflorum]